MMVKKRWKAVWEILVKKNQRVFLRITTAESAGPQKISSVFYFFVQIFSCYLLNLTFFL